MIKEKARRPHQRVKGTVLFTVVCVMMVLVVFLMGTLALASTANKRANYRYMKAQNETIARTVIDAVVTDIQHDTSQDGINNALATKASFDMQVELDGRSYPVTVSRGGKQCWYDATFGWVEGDVVNLTATVASVAGNEPVNYNASLVMAIQQNQNNNNVNPNPAGGAFVSLGNISPKIGTTGLTTGGTEVNLGGSPTDKVEIGHSNSTTIETPVYINGWGDMLTDVKLYIPSMQYEGDDKKSVFFAITGDLKLQNSPLRTEFGPNMKWKNVAQGPGKSTNYANIPCMFVGGTIYANTKEIELGNENNAMNLYCGSFETGNGMKVYGDIYCFDANKTSTSGGSSTPQDNNLYKWSKKQIKNPQGNIEDHEFGNLYSKGNLDLSKSGGSVLKIGGDVRAEGNISISGTEIKGDLVCGGALLIGDDVKVDGDIYANTLIVTAQNGVSAKKVYCNSIAGTKINAQDVFYDGLATSVTINMISSGTIHYVKNQYEQFDCVQYVYEIVINTGGNTITIPRTLTGQYAGHDPGMPTAPNANIDIQGNKHEHSTGNVSATEYKKGAHMEKIYPSGYTKSDIESNVLTIPQASQYSDPTSFPTTRAELNALVTIMDSSNNLTISQYNGSNAPATITTSCLLSGSASQDLLFKPNGTIAVILNNVNMNGKRFIIDDTNGTVLFFVEGKFENSATGGALLTKHYADLIAANGYQFTVTRNNAADYPKVYIYGAQGSSIDMDANTLITANIRAPKSTYIGHTGVENNVDITYIDSDTAKIKYIGIIGQCIAGDIQVNNSWGLAYVEPNSNNNNNNQNQNQNQQNQNNNATYSTNGGTINYTIY